MMVMPMLAGYFNPIRGGTELLSWKGQKLSGLCNISSCLHGHSSEHCTDHEALKLLLNSLQPRQVSLMENGNPGTKHGSLSFRKAQQWLMPSQGSLCGNLLLLKSSVVLREDEDLKEILCSWRVGLLPKEKKYHLHSPRRFCTVLKQLLFSF